MMFLKKKSSQKSTAPATKSPLSAAASSSLAPASSHPDAKPSTAHAAPAAKLKPAPAVNDIDFGSLRLADEELGSLSSSDEDNEERRDTFDGPSSKNSSHLSKSRSDGASLASRGGKGLEKKSSDDMEEDLLSGDDEADVVSRARTKRGPMGLLAGRGRRGSEDEASNSSDSWDEGSHGELEDLVGGVLDPTAMEEEPPTSDAMEAKGPALPIDVLREVPFFAQFKPEHQEQLFSELQEETFYDGDSVVKQGEIGDKFYVIIEGEAVVSKQVSKEEVIDLTHIYSGDFFGELVLIYGGERIASVYSVGKTVCMSLSRTSFEKYDDIRYFLILQKVPLLSGLPRDTQLQIVQRLKPAKFNKDEYVVKQGDRGDAFFMITKGSALVVEDEDKIITRLYEGHSFGEMALLSDEPRIASVKAATELNLMYLSAEDFRELLGASDFSELLERENRKIRELRDRRQWKRANSVAKTQIPQASPMSPGMPAPQHPPGSAGSRNPAQASAEQAKRLRSTSQTTKPPGMQQKLKTGKTVGGAKVINGYILLQQVGKGTFGVVRLCQKQDSGEKYAIKIIDKKLFDNKFKSKHQGSLEDMRREAAIMKRLNHPNVVNLIDVIDDPSADQLYLVQEFCEKGAIMEKLEGNHPLNESTARHYFRDLLQGIDYLHAHSIIHRDIKPMNLLLTADGVVKIGDFGAARVLQGGTKAVGIAGTPAFMAPELLSQDAALYDGPAVDLWSCGATLFMLVTGVPPWMADDEPTLAKRVQNDELIFPGNWSKVLSPHLRNLITRLLVKDPSMRLNLTDTVEHEWVTEEGSEPIPRFIEPQQQLLRVNSKLFNLVSAEEKSTAISLLEASGGDTPQTPQLRKSPSMPMVGLSTSQARNLRTDSTTSSFVEDDGFDSDAEKSRVMTAGSDVTMTDSVDVVDYAQWDIGKKTDDGDKTKTSSLFSANRRKKMSVVEAITRRLPTKERIKSQRGRALSKDFSMALLDTPKSPTADHRRKTMGVLPTAAAAALKPAQPRIDHEEVVSLSDILGDHSLFHAAQQSKQLVKQDLTLVPLAAAPVAVRARRGNAVSHASLRYGFAESAGVRPTNEDTMSIVPKMKTPETFFCAVFDGHGGEMVSRELKARFHKTLTEQPDFVLEGQGPFANSVGLPQALRRACLALDRHMLYTAAEQLIELESKVERGDQAKSLFRTTGSASSGGGLADAFRRAGSTGIMCCVRGGGKPKSPCVLTVAWVGDSRAILSRGGKPFELSIDHKASRPDEMARVRASGGTVDRHGRLYGDLAVSRAFGDLQHKGRDLKSIIAAGPLAKPGDEELGSEGTLIALPDVVQVAVRPEDEFFVVASDGLWDVMSNEQVVNFVRFHIFQHGDVRKAASELVDKALTMGSVDNVSAVVVSFHPKV